MPVRNSARHRDCQCSRVLTCVPTGHADRGPNARHAPRLPLGCFCRGRSVNAALWASLPFQALSFHSGIPENIGTTHISLQTSGCALSCGGTNTFWFTGACIPTGNKRTDARRCTCTCKTLGVRPLLTPVSSLLQQLRQLAVRERRGGRNRRAAARGKVAAGWSSNTHTHTQRKHKKETKIKKKKN